MDTSSYTPQDIQPMEEALRTLVTGAATNIAGVDFASISVRSPNQPLSTLAATDPLAEQIDAIQYELREGPCYDAVTDERFVLTNDLTTTTSYPRFGPRALAFGVRAQAAIQLVHNGEQAGLNLYARTAGAFDRATIQLAELFAAQAATMLGYARQVETLGEAMHARQDIGTAVGIIMERYVVDRDTAFAFLIRYSNDRNTKLRTIAQQIIDRTFDPRAPDTFSREHRA